MREGRQPRVRPVFLDRSGRRRRFAVLLGTGLAAALLAGLSLLVVALSGAASVDVPGFPDIDRRADAPDALPTTTPATTPAPVRRPADPVPTSASPPPATVTSGSPQPGNRRNPTHTPPHTRPPKSK